MIRTSLAIRHVPAHRCAECGLLMVGRGIICAACARRRLDALIEAVKGVVL